MRAKDPNLEMAQTDRLNDENNLNPSLPLPFAFEALLCKFKYKCLHFLYTLYHTVSIGIKNYLSFKSFKLILPSMKHYLLLRSKTWKSQFTTCMQQSVFSFTFEKAITYMAMSRARIKIIFYKFSYIVVISKICSRLSQLKD